MRRKSTLSNPNSSSSQDEEKQHPFASVLNDLKNLLETTLLRGESNSALLLGPRGIGKTRLAREALGCFAGPSSGELSGEGLLVDLHGLLQTDDRNALKEITRQLRLENVVGEKVFGSFAEHLEFLLQSLKSGGRTKSKPIVFLLDEFDLFAGHHNQTLLYNLFDVAQSKAAPICVIGLSCQLDVIERLEKRVRSRFSHRQLYMHNLDSFSEYKKVAESMLSSRGLSLSNSDPSSAAEVDKMLLSVYELRRDLGYLSQVIALAQIFDKEDFTKGLEMSLKHLNVDMEADTISGLTLLEVSLLIACKHISFLYESQPFNFEMVYHEFSKFVNRRTSNVLKYEKPIVAKAFESLISHELLTPTDKISKVQKEYRLYALQVTPQQIIGVTKADKGLPLDLKEWAVSELH